MEKEEGVDKRLKAENPVECVRRVNGIKANVEEKMERWLQFYNSTYRNTVYMSNCVEGMILIFTIICDII